MEICRLMKLHQYGLVVHLGNGFISYKSHDILWRHFAPIANDAIIKNVIRDIRIECFRHGKWIGIIKADRHWTPALLELKVNSVFSGTGNGSETYVNNIMMAQSLMRHNRMFR